MKIDPSADIGVPPSVEAPKVEARFDKGVLSITLPKTGKARSQRKVSIKRG